MSELKDGYELIKEVWGDAKGVGKEIAPWVFNEVNLDGSPTDRMGPHKETVPDDGVFKPTSGNKTFDSIYEWFQ